MLFSTNANCIPVDQIMNTINFDKAYEISYKRTSNDNQWEKIIPGSTKWGQTYMECNAIEIVLNDITC